MATENTTTNAATLTPQDSWGIFKTPPTPEEKIAIVELILDAMPELAREATRPPVVALDTLCEPCWRMTPGKSQGAAFCVHCGAPLK